MFEKEFIQYLSSEKRFSPHTLKSYTTDLSQFLYYLKKEFQITDIQEVNFHLIRSWVAFLLEKGFSARTVTRKISTLKTYFRFLLRISVISENPILKITPPKTKKRLPIFIPEKNMHQLLDEISFEDSFQGNRDRLILEFFYATGVRLSELINIKIIDFDFYKDSVKILGKRDKERIIPLAPKLINNVKDFLSRHNREVYLFTTFDGNKLYHKKVYRIVKKYIKLISSIDKRSPHILRHTFATHMLNNGADIKAIKELLGHANLSATQLYTHNSIDKLKKIHKQAHPRA